MAGRPGGWNRVPEWFFNREGEKQKEKEKADGGQAPRSIRLVARDDVSRAALAVASASVRVAFAAAAAAASSSPMPVAGAAAAEGPNTRWAERAAEDYRWIPTEERLARAIEREEQRIELEGSDRSADAPVVAVAAATSTSSVESKARARLAQLAAMAAP